MHDESNRPATSSTSVAIAPKYRGGREHSASLNCSIFCNLSVNFREFYFHALRCIELRHARVRLVASCSPKERRKQRSGHVAFDTHPVGWGSGHGERRPLRLGRTTKSPRWWCSLEVLLRISTRGGAYSLTRS